ncbi:hypothetical protein [Cellulomonas sp. Root137]|uniref:hypothetical protein n=1 Tax=Cellulomonas sp. Root137 TaxID=1736459 RepID=UPI0006FB508E|nr:hypothetical protein [Cellulomonas sp. Root137]KQY41870.1 hypothetical protein ASD18_19730 [Cellulomonas sp. Root137]
MTALVRLPVGWCHSCGTLQLREEMPTKKLPWTDGPEPVCVNDPGEPWGMGVWPKGEHLPDCPVVELARARDVDWTPTLGTCTCADSPDDEGAADLVG